MKTHTIKILEDFADAVASGEKTFEIRENDRGYQKGDCVRFVVVDKSGVKVKHPLSGNKYAYEITYVINGWGLKEGYVVFGIKKVKEVEE